MNSLKYIKRNLKETLDNRMTNIDKLVEKLDPEDINYQPCGDEKSLTMGELLTHMYEMVFAYTKGTLQGKLTDEDFKEIAVPKKGASLEEVKTYIRKIKDFFRESIDKLTSDMIKQEITFECWGGITLTGYESLMTIIEEIIHHRGQLTLYLRLTGVELPIAFIYDVD